MIAGRGFNRLISDSLDKRFEPVREYFADEMTTQAYVVGVYSERDIRTDSVTSRDSLRFELYREEDGWRVSNWKRLDTVR
jgi:hypothetical protein